MVSANLSKALWKIPEDSTKPRAPESTNHTDNPSKIAINRLEFLVFNTNSSF